METNFYGKLNALHDLAQLFIESSIKDGETISFRSDGDNIFTLPYVLVDDGEDDYKYYIVSVERNGEDIILHIQLNPDTELIDKDFKVPPTFTLPKIGDSRFDFIDLNCENICRLAEQIRWVKTWAPEQVTQKYYYLLINP